MKPTLDPVAWHVMDATADDWESVEQIIPDVERWLGPQDRQEIEIVIQVLLEKGLFEIMPLASPSTRGTPSDIRPLWFGMTTEGRRLWDRDGAFYRNEK